MRSAAFFPPGLHPVLDGGVGDKDPMVAPEMPTGGLIGQAVLHHQPDGQGHDPMGVVGPGHGQVGQVGGKEVAAPDAVMLGVSELEVTRPAPHRIAQIMQGAGPDPIPRARFAALRARPMLVISTAPDELRGRQQMGIGETQGGVWRVDCRAEHGVALRSKRLFSLILRLGPSSVIPKSPAMMLKSLKFPAGRAFGESLNEDAPPDFSPVVHVVVHRSTP